MNQTTTPTFDPAKRVYLTTEQAAKILGLSTATLEDWRWQRKGPPFTRVSRGCVRYEEAALFAWLDAQTVQEIPPASGM